MESFGSGAQRIIGGCRVLGFRARIQGCRFGIQCLASCIHDLGLRILGCGSEVRSSS